MSTAFKPHTDSQGKGNTDSDCSKWCNLILIILVIILIQFVLLLFVFRTQPKAIYQEESDEEETDDTDVPHWAKKQKLDTDT